MDRLSALIVLAAALAACEETKPAGDPPSRVNGAKTTQRQGATVEAFCDVFSSPDKATKLSWPTLGDNGSPPPAASGWRWINVWSTWCKPCVEEIPRLVKWKAKLSPGGKPLDLVFVSADESADDIAEFKKSNTQMSSSLRIADSKAQEAWFAKLGLQGAPPIPIHVFVDPEQRVRCVRAGGVRDKDYEVVEKLLAQ